jgi:hypothetical protein
MMLYGHCSLHMPLVYTHWLTEYIAFYGIILGYYPMQPEVTSRLALVRPAYYLRQVMERTPTYGLPRSFFSHQNDIGESNSILHEQ